MFSVDLVGQRAVSVLCPFVTMTYFDWLHHISHYFLYGKCWSECTYITAIFMPVINGDLQTHYIMIVALLLNSLMSSSDGSTQQSHVSWLQWPQWSSVFPPDATVSSHFSKPWELEGSFGQLETWFNKKDRRSCWINFKQIYKPGHNAISAQTEQANDSKVIHKKLT